MLSETRPAKVGKWTEPALRVLRERYLTREGGEVVETPEEMCWRVALSIAAGEARYGRSQAAVREIGSAFYEVMVDGYFLPNSPTLMNAGKGNGLQYSACYVLPVGDSMEEIFDSVKAAAIIHKSGGGTGFAFSRLRPKDDIVASTGGRASGPISFLRVFNSATEAVKQGGTRRGANMGILRVDHRGEDGDWSIDWDEMERVVRLAVRFLDDVIEMNPYPLPEIDATVKSNRRIGLGLMGWADLLFTMGIPYDSPGAIDLADRLMAFVKEKSHDQSAKLAEDRGPFPNWSLSIYANDRPLRNSTVTTIAPTGTISMIAGCSSGIEPIFALAFEHRVKQPDGERVLTFVNETFERIAKERSFYSDALMREIAKRGSLHGIPGVPEDAARIFKTSHEVSHEWHVRHQAAVQRYTDNGVSKTSNLTYGARE